MSKLPKPGSTKTESDPPGTRGRRVTALRTRSVFADMLELDLPADQRAVAETIFASQGAPTSAQQVTVAGPASTVFEAQPQHSTDVDAIRSFARSVDERYRLRDELGRGGMATVYDVIDMDLRRHVAMKILQEPKRPASSAASSDDRTPLQRFIEEAQITGQLEHPNIVPVHEIGVDGEGRVYFTMKRVEGRSLREVMDDMRRGDLLTLEHFDLFELCEIFIKVCDAIRFAHSRGVIHRDLKPDNVMVGRFGEVQVMDWGLAKVMARPERKDLERTASDGDFISTGSDSASGTLDGTISGTPAYMPPEQARGQISKIDERSDVFALGALLYEMITLVPPYHARSSRDALRRAQKYELRTPAESVALLSERRRLPDDSPVSMDAIHRARKMPAELAAIAMRALSERQEHRYPKTEQLSDEVERFLKNEPVQAYRDPPLKALAKWSGRHRVLSASAAAVFVMAMLSGLIVLVIMKGNTDALLESERRELASAEKARQAAEERAQIEREQANKAATRARALIPFNRGTDLVNRASASVDPDTAYDLELRAKEAFTEAIEIDPSFEGAYVWRGHVNEMLGLIDAALDDLLYANQIRRDAGETEDPASLVNAAMLSATRSLIVERRPSLGTRFAELFKRAQAAAPEGSAYHQLAAIMVDWTESYEVRARGEYTDEAYAELLEDLYRRMDGLREAQGSLWEVHLFSGVLLLIKSRESGRYYGVMAAETAKQHFNRAQRIRPQIPLVTWIISQLIPERGGAASNLAERAVKQWDDYIERFPYDPLGYIGRSHMLVSLDPLTEGVGSPVEDLQRALELNPNMDEVRLHMPRASFWTGETQAAIDAYQPLLAEFDPADDALAQNISRAYVQAGLMRRTPVGLHLALLTQAQLARTERLLDALRVLQERCQQAPEVYRAYFHATLRNLQREGYAEDLRLVISQRAPKTISPTDRFDIARAYAFIGDLERARAAFDQAEEGFKASGSAGAANNYRLTGNAQREIERQRELIDGLQNAAATPVAAQPVEIQLAAARLKQAQSSLSEEDRKAYLDAVVMGMDASLAEMEMALKVLSSDNVGNEVDIATRFIRGQAQLVLDKLATRSPERAKSILSHPDVAAFLQPEEEDAPDDVEEPRRFPRIPRRNRDR